MASKSSSEMVFVYGTLKTDEPNHRFLKNQNNGFAMLRGSAVTTKKWPLVIATRYNIPFLVNCDGKGHRVMGELYEVDGRMLCNLDRLLTERTFKLYHRMRVEVNFVGRINLVNFELDLVAEAVSLYVLWVWSYFHDAYKERLSILPCMTDYTSDGPHGLQYRIANFEDDDHPTYLLTSNTTGAEQNENSERMSLVFHPRLALDDIRSLPNSSEASASSVPNGVNRPTTSRSSSASFRSTPAPSPALPVATKPPRHSEASRLCLLNSMASRFQSPVPTATRQFQPIYGYSSRTILEHSSSRPTMAASPVAMTYSQRPPVANSLSYQF